MAIIQNEQIYRNRVEMQINKGRGDIDAGDDYPVFVQNLPSDVQPAEIAITPNEIDNSDFDFSKDAYLNRPALGGDVAAECYNFFRQRFIRIDDAVVTAGSANLTSQSGAFKAAYTYPMNFVLLGAAADGKSISGTITRVSDNAVTLSAPAGVSISGGIMWFGTALAESAAQSLKATAHSLFAANEGASLIIPRWDTVNGWTEAGSNTADKFDTALPLPINLVRSGLRFYFRAIVARRTGTLANTNPLRIGFGVWDNTVNQQKFIEGGNLSLTVEPVGATGGTAYQYKVFGVLDSGLMIETNIISIANGNANLSTFNYNRLVWSKAGNILDYVIYRSSGGTVKKIFTVSNGARSYNDYGNYDEGIIGNFPTAGTRRAIAYAESEFVLGDEDAWQSVSGYVDVPPTYDSSQTTGKQWIRIQILGVMTDVRQVLIDRLLFSLGSGGWNRSIRDRTLIANQSPSSNPVGSNQGGTGIEDCFAGNTPLVVGKKDGTEKRRIPICEADRGMYVDGGNGKMYRIRQIKLSSANAWNLVELENGIWFECTDSERFITSRADKNGTRIDELLEGDDILCKIVARSSKSAIARKLPITSEQKVPIYTLSLFGGGKTFVVGHLPPEIENLDAGAIAHNRKLNPLDQYQQYQQ